MVSASDHGPSIEQGLLIGEWWNNWKATIKKSEKEEIGMGSGEVDGRAFGC
jgi:hypothetical protein